MIVNHQHRFIFLKTSKTAGTSIEIALSACCDQRDIVTPVSEEDERLREAAVGWRATSYYAPWYAHNPRDWYRRMVQQKKKLWYYNHIPARKLMARLDSTVWQSYFKFCVARNPWDRVISQYHWRYRDLPAQQRPGMDDFLNSSHVRSLQRKGHGLYMKNGQPLVDKVLRFESLGDELDELKQTLNLPGALALPHAKGGHRQDKRHYRDVLTTAQRDRIADLFAPEIALMGYRF